MDRRVTLATILGLLFFVSGFLYLPLAISSANAKIADAKKPEAADLCDPTNWDSSLLAPTPSTAYPIFLADFLSSFRPILFHEGNVLNLSLHICDEELAAYPELAGAAIENGVTGEFYISSKDATYSYIYFRYTVDCNTCFLPENASVFITWGATEPSGKLQTGDQHYDYQVSRKSTFSKDVLAVKMPRRGFSTLNVNAYVNTEYWGKPKSKLFSQAYPHTCTKCSGAGKVSQWVSSGSRYVTCDSCNGRGDFNCTSRWGAPHDYSQRYKDGTVVVCSKCNGTGRVTCSSCNGSGRRLEGTGSYQNVACSTCSGAGVVTFK